MIDTIHGIKGYGTYLYSGSGGAKNAVLGDPIRGVFDTASYALFFLALTLSTLLAWAAKSLESPGFPLSTAVTYMFAIGVNQGGNSIGFFWPEKWPNIGPNKGGRDSIELAPWAAIL